MHNPRARRRLDFSDAVLSTPKSGKENELDKSDGSTSDVSDGSNQLVGQRPFAISPIRTSKFYGLSCNNPELTLRAFQAGLLKLLEAVLELEFRVRYARSDVNASGVRLDKLSVSQHHASPVRSSTSLGPQTPLVSQRLFILTVMNALKRTYRAHHIWLSLVAGALPFFEKSTGLVALHATEQLCKNLDVCLKRCCDQAETTAADDEDPFPADYLANALEYTAVIMHFCLLDSFNGCNNTAIGQTSTVGNENAAEKTAVASATGDIFTNLFRVFTFSDAVQSKAWTAKPETSFIAAARQQLFASFPHILATLCNVWKAATSSGVFANVFFGSPSRVSRLLLDLLNPLAVNHPRQFLSSMALVWLSRSNPQKHSEVDSEAQSDLVSLLLNIKAFPLENILLGVLQTLKQPVRVKNTSEKDAFPLEVSLLEMVQCTLSAAPSATLKSCWSTVQQLLTEAGLVTQVSYSKLYLFRIFVDFVDRGLVSDDKSRKEFQDVCYKLVEWVLEIVGSQLAQPTWLKRTLVVKDFSLDDSNVISEEIDDSCGEDPAFFATSVKDANNNNKRDAIACGKALGLMSEKLPNLLDALYKSEDKDKLQLLLSQVWYNAYPFLKKRHRKNAQNFASCSKFLAKLSRFPLSRTVWRKSALDLLCDPQFFRMDSACARHWMTIVDNLMTQDRSSFKDLLVRTAAAQSSGLFTSKEQEYELRAASLKRLTFAILSSETDQYQPNLPEIQERLIENLRLSHVPHVYGEVLVCCRALLVRLSQQHLVQFWPTIVAELVNVLTIIEEDIGGTSVAPNDYKCARDDQMLQLYLAACKLLEALYVLPPERMTQFQMYSWVFYPTGGQDSNKGYLDHATRIVREFEVALKKKKPSSVETSRASLLDVKTLYRLDELRPFFVRLLRRSMETNHAPLADSEIVSPEAEAPSASSSGKEPQLVQLARAPWDPLSCPEWDKHQPSPQCLQRIRRDLTSLYSDPPHGVFAAPDESDLTRVHALIVGPYDTPYEGGFFYFLLRCPPDYPIKPPRVRLITTGGDRVRFNPNLYRNGKVCLSILGTWSGPAWSPAQSLSSVLISIQSLLNENPYSNEPGFEKELRSGDSERYNRIVSHETVRVAVCEFLEAPPAGCPESLVEVARGSFGHFYDRYARACRQLRPLQGSSMADPFGEKRGVFDPEALTLRLAELKTSLATADADDLDADEDPSDDDSPPDDRRL